ncbi:ABC transporter substrate-binding protein [Xaviernesmea oryzae]|uniref:Peptide/nickel transport system substrate-binding protein n=1 Tax=Xaviernesmea oryzae TaxID=464029 RepID=A0A1X7DUS4_9HYPH|nr:ABC transporter substrate-binding protein [Xaviernesmea oryzae]SMF22083.1 peptide/nickel transport system substrate-binding protein [Xaviernesmea oryzae]
MKRHLRGDQGNFKINRRAVLQGFAATVALPYLSMPGLAKAQDAPLYGGTFIVGSGTEPRHLNQNVTTDSSTKLISNPIFSKLVGLKSDFTPAPDLARSWTVSDDGLVYTFDLEDGVTWHDGKPLTSEDVKFTFEKVLFEFHNIGKSLGQFVQSVTTPDAKTVVFTLKSPNDVFMTFVAGQSYIQPKHIYDGTDIMNNPANLKPIGSGPFKFSEWARGREVVLVRNENYFKKDRPYVDRIVTRFIPEASARARALEAGEIDYVAYFDLPPSMVADLQKNSDITVVSQGHEAWGSIVELMMNLDKAPYNDVRVRRAITHAIDRNFIIAKANYGLSKIATGPISSEIAWAYDPDTRQYPHDVAEADKLLDEAGLARDGDGIRFKAGIVVTRTIEANLKTAQIIAEQLKKVGIAVEVLSMDAATTTEAVYLKRDYDMFIQSLTTGPDPAMGMQRQYISTNIRPIPFTNGIGYRNPKVDDLLSRAASDPNRQKRAALYKEASAVLCEDAALVWLYENAAYSAFNSAFGNLHSWAAESIYSYGDVYWKEGESSRS